MREKELQRIGQILEGAKIFLGKNRTFQNPNLLPHCVPKERRKSNLIKGFTQFYAVFLSFHSYSQRQKPLTLSSITMHDGRVYPQLLRELKAIKFHKRHEILTSIYFPPKFLSSFSPKYRQVILGFLGKKNNTSKGMGLSFSACIFFYLYPFMNLYCEYTKICKNLLKKKYIQYVNKRKGLGISYLISSLRAFSLLCYFFSSRCVENKPLIINDILNYYIGLVNKDRERDREILFKQKGDFDIYIS